MKKAVLLAMILLAFTVVLTATASPETVSVIIQASDVETAVALAQRHGGKVDERLAIINGVSAELSTRQLAQLSADPQLVRVHRESRVSAAFDDIVTAPPAPPNTYFPEQVGAPRVWQQGITGSGVGVAVVDTGIGVDSSFLAARYDALDYSLSPYDAHGHGTLMASLIANPLQDNNGYISIAPGVDLIDVRVMGADGSGTYADILEGLDWILANHATYNIQVVNLSLVAGPNEPYWDNPINQAVEALWEAGIVVVTAAGNAGPEALTISVPGNDPFVITVGSITDNHTPADPADDYIPPFSGAGPTETGFIKPDVLAPGTNLVAVVRPTTTWAIENPEQRIYGPFYRISGTSASTAVTSGVVALMRQANPQLTPDEIKYALMDAARPAVDAEGLAWSVYQQGAGRVWAPHAVLNPAAGEANGGMLIGEPHLGPVIFRDEYFRLVDEASNDLP
ncbi:MAG: S8 family peptidase, partial [Anaerolineales bacterium]|nr:S8 family peptidase [Anaerolineales bacterium]